MTASPKVSIIVPCYNGARFLFDLVTSLDDFRRKNVEIIFVDDGSEDGSAGLFGQLVPEATIIRQKNAGVAAARNAGAAVARGEFLQLLDADDRILPGKFEAQLAAAEAHDLDVVTCDWRMVVVHPDRTETEPLCSGAVPADPVAGLLGGWWATFNAYLIRRTAYEQVGGSDDSLVNAQDFDLLVRLAIAGKKFGAASGHFADYYRYIAVQSLARGPRDQYWGDYETAIAAAATSLDTRGEMTPERRAAVAKRMHHIARMVYPIDRNWFARIADQLYCIDPEFKPDGPPLYKAVCSIFGMAGAERIAFLMRLLKN